MNTFHTQSKRPVINHRTRICQFCEKQPCDDMICVACRKRLNDANHKYIAHLESLGLPMPDLNPPMPVTRTLEQARIRKPDMPN